MIRRVPGESVQSALKLGNLRRGDVVVTRRDVDSGDGALGEEIKLEFLLLEPGDDREKRPFHRGEPVRGFPGRPVRRVQHDIRVEFIDFRPGESRVIDVGAHRDRHVIASGYPVKKLLVSRSRGCRLAAVQVNERADCRT